MIAFTLAVIVFACTFCGILSRFIHASPVLITLPDANLKLVFYAFKNVSTNLTVAVDMRRTQPGVGNTGVHNRYKSRFRPESGFFCV